MVNTLSPEYEKQIKKLHSESNWGNSGATWFHEIQRTVKGFGHPLATLEVDSILDYGCGKGTMKEVLEKYMFDGKIYEYDPGIEGKEKLPEEDIVDLVISTDVLEHIEPEYLDVVLEEIRAYSHKYAFLVIACKPAKAILPDGRNAHLIVEPPDWWLKKLREKFQGYSVFPLGDRPLHEKKKNLAVWIIKR